jgi:hypothetical protein
MEFLGVFAIELAKDRDKSLLVTLSLLELRGDILLLIAGKMGGAYLGNEKLGVVKFENLGSFFSDFMVDLCGEISEHGWLELSIFFDSENEVVGADIDASEVEAHVLHYLLEFFKSVDLGVEANFIRVVSSKEVEKRTRSGEGEGRVDDSFVVFHIDN